MSASSPRGRGRRALLFLVASAFFVTSGALVAGHAQAQSLSTASVSVPPPVPPGFLTLRFSVDKTTFPVAGIKKQNVAQFLIKGP